MRLDPLSVVKFESTRDDFSAIIAAEPTEPGAFAYPDDGDPDGFWARRVPVRCEVLS